MKESKPFATRRTVLRNALLTAGVAMVSAGAGSPANAMAAAKSNGADRAGRQLPDIFIVMADDLSWTDIAPNGSPDARTPNLAKFAREGLRFTRAFCTSPTCTPSRSSMLTGDYPMRDGAHANHSNINPSLKTMPHYLKALGYRVVIAGKTDIGPPSAFPFEYLEGSTVHPAGVKNVLRSHLHTQSIEHLLATRDPNVPLAVFVASYQPHVPWAKNPTYDPVHLTLPVNFVDTPETRHARASYLTDVSDLDREFGDVRTSIEKHGKGKNTLVVFTADHGSQFPFAKWNLYDPGIHVPLIAAWPGHIAGGKATDAMVSLVDLLPTVIEAAGGAAPEDIDGKSFMPVLLGRQDKFHDEIFAAHTGDLHRNHSPMRGIRTDRWKLILNLNPDQLYITALTQGHGEDNYWSSWVNKAKSDPAAAAIVHRYQHRPPIELYDLKADPDEQHNLADDPQHAAILKELRGKVDQWRLQQGEKLTDVPMPQDAHFGPHKYAEWS